MGISQSLNLKINTRLCHREVYHSPQQGQSRQQRITQMKGVFNIAPKEVDQRINSIAIIDDVMTTGATVQALSKKLITAWGGPLDIQIWCVARAQPPDILLDW
jgi:predicted amidophosphoribosyltransferase